MHTQTIVLSTLLLALRTIKAAEIDEDDVPEPCQVACAPIVAIAQQCSDDHSSWFGDSAELDCICNATEPVVVRNQLPECDACVRWQKTWLKNHGDIVELNDHCGFPRLQSFGQSTGLAAVPSLTPASTSPASSTIEVVTTSLPGGASATITSSGTASQASGANEAGVNRPVGGVAAAVLAAVAAGMV